MLSLLFLSTDVQRDMCKKVSVVTERLIWCLRDDILVQLWTERLNLPFAVGFHFPLSDSVLDKHGN